MKKIVLVDGHNLLFRMFYGIPAPIKNSKGKDIRGLIGFIGGLKKIVNEFKPDSLCVIFDSETSQTNNLTIDSEYKANRVDYTNVDSEENPFSQLPLIKKTLDYLNIYYSEVENNEADDFIDSLVSKNDNDNQYIIVSTDSDFIQLVNDDVLLYVPRGKKSILLDKVEVEKKYDIPPQKYILFKSLVGDKSDNIKGIKGIGSVTAAKILKYDSIASYIKDNPSTKITGILLANEELITKNEKLITMNRFIDTSNVFYNELDNKIYNAKTYEIITEIKEN